MEDDFETFLSFPHTQSVASLQAPQNTIRVSSLPSGNTQERITLNKDSSRIHSNPTVLPKTRATKDLSATEKAMIQQRNAEFASGLKEHMEMQMRIAKLERKIDQDLNDIIEQFC